MVNFLKKNAEENTSIRTIRPAVDIAEQETAIVLEVDLPGANKNSLRVELNKSVLSIYAEKHKDGHQEKYTPLYQERYSNIEYHREFELNAEVDQNNIQAHFYDGVLRLTLAKSRAAQPKRIEII